MKRTLNPDLDRIVLDALAEKYKLLERREGIHLSDLTYCLTKSYWDCTAPLPPTDKELLLFATGYGLQEVMTPSCGKSLVYELDEITYRPDSVFPVTIAGVESLVEMKSTRAGVKRYQDGELPETWVTYMMGGAFIRDTDTYHLAVIYLAERGSAAIISETITFEREELEYNWKWLLERKDIYKKALRTEIAPDPFIYNVAKWLCTNCRYRTVCDAVTIMSRKEQVEKDIKELWGQE